MTEQQRIARAKTCVYKHKECNPGGVPLKLVQYPDADALLHAFPRWDGDYLDHLLEIDVARQYADEIGVSYEIVRA